VRQFLKWEKNNNFGNVGLTRGVTILAVRMIFWNYLYNREAYVVEDGCEIHIVFTYKFPKIYICSGTRVTVTVEIRAETNDIFHV
jgi:hypothetical protein